MLVSLALGSLKTKPLPESGAPLPLPSTGSPTVNCGGSRFSSTGRKCFDTRPSGTSKRATGVALAIGSKAIEATARKVDSSFILARGCSFFFYFFFFSPSTNRDRAALLARGRYVAVDQGEPTLLKGRHCRDRTRTPQWRLRGSPQYNQDMGICRGKLGATLANPKCHTISSNSSGKSFAEADMTITSSNSNDNDVTSYAG